MKTNPSARSRRGTYIPFLAVSVTGLFMFVALAIDLGMMTIGRTECQNAADTGALVGARVLTNRPGVTENDKATAVLAVKHVIPQNTFIKEAFAAPTDSQIQIGQYNYNTTSQQFSPDFTKTSLGSGESWTAVRTTVSQSQPTFFAKVFGVTSLPNGATATAIHRPRDVAIVLDFSASMRFGSMTMWPSNYAGDSTDNPKPVRGFMNPDPNIPRFGHYQRYDAYNPAAAKTSANADSTTVGNRPHPLRTTQAYVTPTGGDVFAPNNHTVETPGGPPMVFDFRFSFDAANMADPSVPVGVSSAVPGNLRNAFHRWFQQTPTDTPSTSLAYVDQTNNYKYSSFRPAVASTTDNTASGATFVERTFNWNGYDALDRTSTNGPVPAPDSFATQEGVGTVAYAGDVYPRKNGATPAIGTTWAPTDGNGAAVNAAELLGWATSTSSWPGTVLNRADTTGSTRFPTGAGRWGYQPAGAPSGVTLTYDANWLNFRDATWERYGYDLDLGGTTSGYVTNRDKNSGGSTTAYWDPRWDWRLTATGGTTNATTVGWQTGGSETGWQHNMKTVSGDSDAPTKPGSSDASRRTVPPDSTATTGTGATSAQSVTFRPQLKVPGTGRISSFNGYSMGPGYWGKTFFIWPPDPRFGVQNPNTGATAVWPDVTSPEWNSADATTLAQSDPAFATRSRAGTTTVAAATLIPMCDWRRRFFTTDTTANDRETNTTYLFDPSTTNIDQTLFSTSTTASTGTGGTAGVLAATGFRVNYRAVLAWLKSGPQVLPPNLRAGRVVYYTSIPNNCDNAATNADQRFWRDYIDFVLGYRGNGVYRPDCTLAGIEYRPWPEGSSLVVRGTSQYYPYTTDPATPNWSTLTQSNSASPAGANPPNTRDPRPYANYADNPTRPRAHFWFGPMSMLDFLGMGPATGGVYRLWWPGNCHESQCWQLKAAMQSALEDIRVNHPNDHCGLTFFAGANPANSAGYVTPRVPMGQDWTSLRNALYYPGPKGSNTATNIVAKLKINSGDTTEVTPYDTADLSGSFSPSAPTLAGILPNSFGGTDPNTGFANAFNTLSSSTSVYNAGAGSGANGGTGRRGASKIVIFETDGNPNGYPQWTLAGTGTNTRYDGGSTANTTSNEQWVSSTMYPSLAESGFRYPRRLADVNFSGATSDQRNAALMALAAVYRINQPAKTSGTSGFSLPNSEARVYPIAFGDLFRGYSVAQNADGTDNLADNAWVSNTSNALAARLGINFLVAAGQVGGTLPIADAASGYPGTTARTLPSANVITGPYQTRINNMRALLERIMQSGVQVTLIE